MNHTTSDQDRTARRPLVVRFGAFGDMVQLTSSLRALATDRGAPCDVLAAHGWVAEVFRGLPFVGTLRWVTSRRAPYWLSASQREAVRWLRERGPGPTWLIERKAAPARKSHWLLRRSGVPEDLVVDSRQLDRGGLEHTLDFELRVVRTPPPGGPSRERSADGSGALLPRLAVTEEERADVDRWLSRRGWGGEPLVVLQTQSRRTNRGRWADARWLETMRAILAERPGWRLLLAGSPAERQPIEELAGRMGDDRVWPAAADLPLRRLFALFTVARSCVSLDSGPAHAAATLGCPLVVLMGRGDPRRCRPVSCGSDVRVVSALPPEEWPDDPVTWHVRNRLEDIAVDDVLAAWRSLGARAALPAPETAA